MHVWSRIGICIVLTLLFAIASLFVPMFNIYSAQNMSLLEEMAQTGQYWDFMIKLLIQSGLFFIGLLFLFGIPNRRKKRHSNQQ